MEKKELLATLSQKFQFLIDRRRIKEAISVARQYISTDPENAHGYYLLAIGLTHQNSYNDALKEINHALFLAPNESGYYLYQGVVYHCMKSYRGAEKSYKEAIRLDPEEHSYYTQLASLFLHYFEIVLAEQYAKKALELNPQSKKAKVILGKISFRKEKYDESEKYFRAALKVDPLFEDALVGLGNIQVKNLEYKEGISTFLSVLKRNPNSKSAKDGLLSTLRFTFGIYRYYEKMLLFIRTKRAFRVTLSVLIVFLLINIKIFVSAPLIFIPLLFILMVILLLGILAHQITNVLLLLHPMARNALTRTQVASGVWVLLHSAGIIIMFVLLFLMPSLNLFLYFLFTYSSLIIISVFLKSRLREEVIVVMGFILLMGLTGLIFREEGRIFGVFFGIYSFMFIIVFIDKLAKFLKGKTEI